MSNVKVSKRNQQPKRLPFGSLENKSRLNPIGKDGKKDASKKLLLTPTKTTSHRTQRKTIVTPSKTEIVSKENIVPTEPKNVSRKLPFGHNSLADRISIPENVKLIYKLVRKITGNIGGNGSSGAIYGELTVGSMQKMVNLMKEHTDFDANSRFIDVGSGIGKPNLHVAQDPGVEFSYGIEMERSRWILGMSCLKRALAEAVQKKELGHRCFFDHGNIKQAKTFDPFTHVYMFSIGFPPTLWDHLVNMFNKSHSPFLICYHSPRHIIERYGFEVELITQTTTSMHGSSEGHTAYLYKRQKSLGKTRPTLRCDPLFQEAYDFVKGDVKSLHATVASRVDKELYGGRVTRAQKIVHCIESDSEDE